MQEFTCFPIGVIRSPFKETSGMPIQAKGAEGISGSVELDRKFADGLKDLEGFSHVILIYRFHLSEGYSLEVKPFWTTTIMGFLPREPPGVPIHRSPCAAGEGGGTHSSHRRRGRGRWTPLLDIKPYVPEFDVRLAEGSVGFAAKPGWCKKPSRRRFK